MKTIYFFLFALAGIISALPVILCQKFYKDNNYKFHRIIAIVVTLLILFIFINVIYFYSIFNNIKMGVFYPIIKLVEMFIPVIIGIFLYEEHYKIHNYIGFLLAFVAIYLIAF